MSTIVDASARARVLLTGRDAPAFLHRLSTQHVTDLKPGDARLSCMTTDKGRIKDLVHHVVLEEGVLLIGHALPAPELIAWLDRYFFTEQLAFEDKTASTTCVEVGAAEADALVPGSSQLAPWAMKRQGDVVVVRGFDGVNDPRFVVVSFGAPLPKPTVSADEARAAAIAAGVPGPAELSESFTPLDLDLHDAIHWSKGCYIGQEVIARLDTYGKQKKHLVGVTGAAAVGEVVDGATVTSASPSAALAIWKGDVTTLPQGRLVRRHAHQQPHD